MSFRYHFAAASLLIAGLATSGSSHAGDLADEVNTLQGTNSRFELTRGNTYPTVALPWGMHTWTPQTGRNGDGWKYQYHKDAIRGFQQAHQCSSWSNDYNVFSLMPVVGKLSVNEHQRAAGFSHKDEIARPHYYRVALDNGVNVELAPTGHGAILRFAFPPDQPAYLVFDGYTGGCVLEIQSDAQRIAGRVRNGRNLPRELSNHFAAQFDQQFVSSGTWRQPRRSMPTLDTAQSISGWRVGAYLEFAPGSTVTVRVASSYIDAAQAELNLQRELSSVADLEEAAAAAKRQWNETLGRVEVSGGTDEQRRTFYSCFFRASLFPRKFFEYDADGQPYYRSPYDGQIYPGYMYTDTGLWDTFRAQIPLNSIVQPEMYGRYVAGMLDAYRQCDWLPSWSFPGEAGSMIGNHAVSVLADAWAKDVQTFDPAVALAAYDHESSQKGPWGPANGRRGADVIERLGYLPSPEYREATAKTLEYAYDDYCGYALARATGHEQYAEKFAKRMLNYRNVFDAETGFMRGRDGAGNWTEPFDPAEWGGPYTEGCAWHWNWSVFHDVAGLIELLGGEEPFVAKLDAVFTASSDFGVGTYGAPIHEMREMVLANMGQYAHGNQPIQHMAYLYAYAGEPWKTQYWVREIMARLYRSDEDGYPGDEDQGQTSSWYVLSAMGFYSVCPGTGEYVLGSPLFERTTIAVADGKAFTIVANNNSDENVYIQSAELNGEPLSRNFLRHQEIMAGGTLTLEMGPEPNRTRGVESADRPYSVTTAEPSAPKD